MTNRPMHLLNDVTIEEATDALMRLSQHVAGAGVKVGVPILVSKIGTEIIVLTDEPAAFFPERDQVSRLIELARANELTQWQNGDETKRVVAWREA